jgi:hypothetical protein
VNESLMCLTLPNSGSTWFGELIAMHSSWSRYCPEFFNPLRNPRHYARLSQRFGCELVSCYKNIALGDHTELLDADIAATWDREEFNFTKEVFSPFKLPAFARRFKCFVLLRSEADTFPPHRLRVWSFYEHAWWALRQAGAPVYGLTVEERARCASRLMQERIEVDAQRLGVPVIHYRELFSGNAQAVVAAAIGECSDELRAAIESTRVLASRDHLTGTIHSRRAAVEYHASAR